MMVYAVIAEVKYLWMQRHATVVGHFGDSETA